MSKIIPSWPEIPALKQAQRVNPHGSMKCSIDTQAGLLRASSHPERKGVALWMVLRNSEKYTGESTALKWNSQAAHQFHNRPVFSSILEKYFGLPMIAIYIQNTLQCLKKWCLMHRHNVLCYLCNNITMT